MVQILAVRPLLIVSLGFCAHNEVGGKGTREGMQIGIEIFLR